MKFFALVKLMRPKQWTKNMFVLAPLIFSFKLRDLNFVSNAMIATLVFCLSASAIYIVNDLIDRKADRRHPKKRTRPLASRDVTILEGALLFFGLVAVVGCIISYVHFNLLFIGLLGLYVVQSVSYSLGIKHVALLELFVVASGYLIRLLAGCAAINEIPSPWILAATGTVALLITAGKRRAEISENFDPDNMRKSLKEYNLAFLDSMITMLASVTVVTYLLFTTSDYAITRFHSLYFVSTSVFVLYGVLRYLQLVKVAAGADDPTTLVLTDHNLCIAVALWLLACIGFIYY
jgi:4-hydroxybenzoate polyprenyltransferase